MVDQTRTMPAARRGVQESTASRIVLVAGLLALALSIGYGWAMLMLSGLADPAAIILVPGI